MNQEKIWDYFQIESIETFAGSIPRLKFIISQAHKILYKASTRDPKVLNIGVGNGWLEIQCVRNRWHTYSLDPSEVAIKRLANQEVIGKVGYIEAMPYEDSSFDIVFCSEVLEHLSDEQLSLGLKEINRVLRKGGYLIGTVPFEENLLDNIVICPECGKRYHRWGHLQSFDKLRIKSVLKEVGLEIMTVSTYAFPDFSRHSIKDKVKSLLAWVLGRMGEQISSPSLFFIYKKP